MNLDPKNPNPSPARSTFLKRSIVGRSKSVAAFRLVAEMLFLVVVIDFGVAAQASIAAMTFEENRSAAKSVAVVGQIMTVGIAVS